MAKVTNLRPGSSGSDVIKMQEALVEAGYDVGKTGADGVFGNNTLAAVKQYQKDHGLAVDGVAGKNTLGSLYGGTNALNAMATAAVAGAQNAAGGDKIVRVEGGHDGAGGAAEPPASETPTEEAPAAEVPAFSYDDFSYGDYAQSDIVQQANALLQQHQSNRPGAYQSQWEAQINEYLNKIMNRDPFSYNFNEDALYQQYKDIYTQMGLMAMMDTMGQASAMTGGYGNSYAQTVGQQAYNQQLSQLNNVLPELYQMAFDRYAYEGDQLMNQYGMLVDRENMDYGRYMDSYNQWASERDYLAGRYESEREYDYNKYTDDRSLAFDQYNAGREDAWNQYVQGLENQEVAAGLLAGVGDYGRVGDLYGLDEDEVAKLETAYNTSEDKGTDEDKGDDVPGYDNGSLQSVHVKLIQKALGVEADGKWGPKSSEAAGGMTAEEAWAAYNRGDFDKKADPDNGGLAEARKDEIYDWLEGVLTNPNLSSSFDPNKLISGSSFLTSEEERAYAKEIISYLSSLR